MNYFLTPIAEQDIDEIVTYLAKKKRKSCIYIIRFTIRGHG